MRSIQCWTVLMLVAGLHGSSGASEFDRGTETTEASEGLLTADEVAIRQAIEGYANGFIRKDMQLLLGLWDSRNASNVSYIAVELPQPIIGIDNLRPYYASFLNTPLIVQSGDISNLRIVQMGGLAYAFCTYTWVYVVSGATLVQSTRASFVLSKRDGRWFYQHFHESILVNS
jgi:hypothetical protein